MALASAKQAGIHVPPQTWVRIDRFLQSVRRGNYGGLASYRPDSPASTSMTAEALYCRLLLAVSSSANRSTRSAAQRSDDATARRVARRRANQSLLLVLRHARAAPSASAQRANRRRLECMERRDDGDARLDASQQTATTPAAGTRTRCGAATAAGSTRPRWPRCAWKFITATRRRRRAIAGPRRGRAGNRQSR